VLSIDDQTFRDLDVFHADDGVTVFDLLDRTRTRGGRDALRRRFRAPSSDPAFLRATQAAVRFVIENRAAFAALPDDARLEPTNRYIASRFTTVARPGGAASFFESAWVRLRYADLYREAESGVLALSTLLASLHSLRWSVDVLEPPPALAELFEELGTLIGSAELAPVVAYRRGPLGWTRTLRLDHLVRERLRARIERTFRVIHEIDALVAMADATSERGFTLPDIADDASLEITGVRHPFVRGAVPNDLRTEEGRRVVFLTGPNMAGKTTWLKSCGLAVYLAHVGMGVPAERMRFAPFDALVTGIRTKDDLREGVSYFLAEVRRVKQAASVLASGARAFVIFDEVFKGTNVKDAFDACGAVVTGFARFRSSVFIVASHLVELVAPLTDVAGIAFAHFEAAIVDGEPRYDYRLRDGHSAQRLGMTLLEREGVTALLNR
jgi:DNA mismatch repair ATPase MutS